LTTVFTLIRKIITFISLWNATNDIFELWPRQGQVEVIDETSGEEKMSVEVLKRAGSIEQLQEITVQLDETINNNGLTVTVRVVSTVLYF